MTSDALSNNGNIPIAYKPVSVRLLSDICKKVFIFRLLKVFVVSIWTLATDTNRYTKLRIADSRFADYEVLFLIVVNSCLELIFHGKEVKVPGGYEEWITYSSRTLNITDERIMVISLWILYNDLVKLQTSFYKQIRYCVYYNLVQL